MIDIRIDSVSTDNQLVIVSDNRGTVEEVIEPQMKIYTTTPMITTTATSSITVDTSYSELMEHNEKLQFEVETMNEELLNLR